MHVSCVEPHLYNLLKFLGCLWISGQFPPIPKGFRNFHEALLVFKDNPPPMHKSTNTAHIITLPRQMSTNNKFNKLRENIFIEK